MHSLHAFFKELYEYEGTFGDPVLSKHDFDRINNNVERCNKSIHQEIEAINEKLTERKVQVEKQIDAELQALEREPQDSQSDLIQKLQAQEQQLKKQAELI